MHVRHFIRDRWLNFSYHAGLSHLYRLMNGRQKGVISLHNVLNTNTLPPYDCYNVDLTCAVFEKQLQFLTRHFKFNPIETLENGENGFYFIVDDGMRNNANCIGPILEKHGITAMFAVCPDMVDKKIPLIWRDHLFLLLRHHLGQSLLLPQNGFDSPYFIDEAALNRLTRSIKKYIYDLQIANPYRVIEEIIERNAHLSPVDLNVDADRFCAMDWSDISKLSERGHRIASHTLSHRVLKFLSREEKARELGTSKKRIEEVIQKPVNTIIYPYGGAAEVDEECAQVSQEVGYQSGYMNVHLPKQNTNNLLQGRFALPHSGSPAHLHAVMTGYKQFFK